MKKELILIILLLAVAICNAQNPKLEKTNPVDTYIVPTDTKPDLLPTDTVILKPTRAQISTVIQLVQHAINLSYSAKLESEKASIPVFLIQALEALNGIKTEDGKVDSVKAKTK